MAKAGTLTVRIIGDEGPFKKSINNSTKAAEGFGSKLKRIGATVAKFGAVAGVVAVGVGAKVLDLGAKMEDLDKKSAAVFEDQLGSVQKWAKENAGAMGLTARELTGLTANFADLLKPMGFTAEQAAGMAQETNELSGALSKWSGGQKSAAEVSQILAKAMLGERDELKSLGISIMEADVQQRLLEKGQKDLTGTALQQAKAIATQELIIEKSTDAQKAWADGQDDLSVKINKVKARVNELKEQAVAKLLPFVVAAAEKFMEWGAAVSERVQPVLRDLSAWWEANGPAIIATAQELWATLQAAFEAIGSAIQTVIGWFRRGEGEAVGSFMSIQAFAAEVWPQIQGIVTSAVEAVRAIIEFVVGIVQHVWENFGDEIMRHAERTWENIQRLIGGILDVIQGVFEVFAGLFTGDWSRLWEGVKQIFSGVKDVIGALWDNLMSALRLILTGAGRALKGIWRGLWEAIKTRASRAWTDLKQSVSDGVDAVVTFFKELPGKIVSALGDLGRLLLDKGKDLVRGLIDGIKSQAGNVAGAIVSAIPGGGAIARGVGAVGRLIPGRAHGGPVTAGRPYLVGERGPELFMPRRSGNIVPNGVGNVNITINAPNFVGDPRQLAEIVQEALLKWQRGQTSLGFS